MEIKRNLITIEDLVKLYLKNIYLYFEYKIEELGEKKYISGRTVWLQRKSKNSGLHIHIEYID